MVSQWENVRQFEAVYRENKNKNCLKTQKRVIIKIDKKIYFFTAHTFYLKTLKYWEYETFLPVRFAVYSFVYINRICSNSICSDQH